MVSCSRKEVTPLQNPLFNDQVRDFQKKTYLVEKHIVVEMLLLRKKGNKKY